MISAKSTPSLRGAHSGEHCIGLDGVSEAGISVIGRTGVGIHGSCEAIGIIGSDIKPNLVPEEGVDVVGSPVLRSSNADGEAFDNINLKGGIVVGSIGLLDDKITSLNSRSNRQNSNQSNCDLRFRPKHGLITA